MQLERILLSEIVPNDLNPRDDYSSVDRLAKNLAATAALNGGEPVNPIVVKPCASGREKKYRVIDGERRYRAMMQNGLEECSAIVCDDWEEVDAILTALATDDKELLTESAKNVGIQEYFDLDLGDESDDAYETVLGLSKGTLKTARNVRKSIGEPAKTASLDMLLAAAEFSDDPAAAQKIIESKDWHYTLLELRSIRKNEKTAEEMMAYIEEHGGRIIDSVPDGYVWVDQIFTAKRLEEFCDDDKCVYYFSDYKQAFVTPYVIVYRYDPDSTDLEEENTRKFNEHREIVGKLNLEHLRFLVEKLNKNEPLPHVGELAIGHAPMVWLCQKTLTQIADNGLVFKPTVTWMDIFSYFQNRDQPFMQSDCVYNVGLCADYITYMDAMVADGYEMTDEDLKLVAEASTAVESEEAEDQA